VLLPKIYRARLSVAKIFEQIFGLVSELFEVGANREVTIVELLRHTDLLQVMPGVRNAGEKEVRQNLDLNGLSGGLGPLRGRVAPCAPGSVYANSCHPL
jgi:hypothetical protein